MATKAAAPVAKNWWRDFFVPAVGEIMFAPKVGQSETEVEQVIRRSRAKPPLPVLDLACGIGRHSLVFARRGFDVTGFDYSKPFLKQAQESARAARLKIGFVRGDMRTLNRHFAPNTFGLVVCLYTSFGYFARRDDDLKVLRGVHRVLRPGGALVVNTVNGAGVRKRLRTPVSLGSEPLPNVFVVDHARYDRRSRQTMTTWTIIDARRARHRIVRKSFRVNVYSHGELKKLLKTAGFRIETAWGMLPGGRFDPRKTWHQTILARKPSAPRARRRPKGGPRRS